MPVAVSYPGVYIEEIPSGVRTITGVATSITAFVGWAPKGSVDRAELVLSWSGYEREFGVRMAIGASPASGAARRHRTARSWDLLPSDNRKEPHLPGRSRSRDRSSGASKRPTRLSAPHPDDSYSPVASVFQGLRRRSLSDLGGSGFASAPARPSWLCGWRQLGRRRCAKSAKRG